MIEDDVGDADAIARELHALDERDATLRRYRDRAGADPIGIPDVAFRGASLFRFRDVEPAHVFRTSGTSGRARGVAEYSPRGLDLMRRSIVARARERIFGALDRPTMIRLVPESAAAPDVVMAYGMQLLARTFGDPATSVCALGPGGLDVDLVANALDVACAEERPVVLVGGSFAYVHLCDALLARGAARVLPLGSRAIDAGGYKGRSRTLDVAAFRAHLGAAFGLAPEACVNLFGMTELASQLYDGAAVALGPNGERPKAAHATIRPSIRDPWTWRRVERGPGMLEVADLCILDRPHVVLTGDRGVASPDGVAIVGRATAAESRGCALSFESPESLPARAPEDRRDDR